MERILGAAEELLRAINPHRPAETPDTSWPRSPRGMSGDLRLLRPNLLASGFDIRLGRREGGSGRRLIRIEPPKRLGVVTESNDSEKS